METSREYAIGFGGITILSVLHIAPIKFNGHSGLSTVIPKMLEEQLKNGVCVSLLLSTEVDTNVLLDAREQYGFEILGIKERKKIDWKSFDLVVFHSTYIPMHFSISRKLVKNNIPYIIVPHGGMTFYSHNRRKVKKTIANMLFFKLFVSDASRIQYLSEGEQKNSDHWGNKYYISPNGMDINSEEIDDFGSVNKVKLNFTSISRLDIENKGLDTQLEAVYLIRESFIQQNAVMHIYGPSIGNSKDVLNKKIKEYGLEEIVKICPPIYDEQKARVLQNTSVFVLLSKSEGQPMGVLEALSLNIPCLLTKETNLADDAEFFGFGWKVENDAQAVANKMLEIFRNRFLLKEFGRNAFQYITTKHSWKVITEELITVYTEIVRENGGVDKDA